MTKKEQSIGWEGEGAVVVFPPPPPPSSRVAVIASPVTYQACTSRNHPHWGQRVPKCPLMTPIDHSISEQRARGALRQPKLGPVASGETCLLTPSALVSISGIAYRLWASTSSLAQPCTSISQLQAQETFPSKILPIAMNKHSTSSTEFWKSIRNPILPMMSLLNTSIFGDGKVPYYRPTTYYLDTAALNRYLGRSLGHRGKCRSGPTEGFTYTWGT